MPLADQFAELDSIAQMIQAEHQLITCMRSQGEPPAPEAEARTYGAAIAQLALMQGPLLCELSRLETEAAWVA